MVAKGFVPMAWRETEQWLFHCEHEQRSHRRKDQASAAKRKDTSGSLRREPIDEFGRWREDRRIFSRRCEKCRASTR
jgi:hypothetical protein